MSTPGTGERSLDTFVTLLASNAPAPGGGAATALVGALSAALAEMVGNLTAGRERFQAAEPEVRRLLGQLAHYRAELLDLIERDAAAYQAVSAAYALPRTTDEERAARAEAVQQALRGAMEPPERMGSVALEVLRATSAMAAIGNPALASDAGCAAVLGEATVRCATLNVLANVVLLRDDGGGVGAMARAAAEARDAEAGELRGSILREVYVRMGA